VLSGSTHGCGVEPLADGGAPVAGNHRGVELVDEVDQLFVLMRLFGNSR